MLPRAAATGSHEVQSWALPPAAAGFASVLLAPLQNGGLGDWGWWQEVEEAPIHLPTSHRTPRVGARGAGSADACVRLATRTHLLIPSSWMQDPVGTAKLVRY